MKLSTAIVVCLVLLQEADGWYQDIENILIKMYNIQQQYLVSESGMLHNSLGPLTNLNINQTSWMELLDLKPAHWEVERMLWDLR